MQNPVTHIHIYKHRSMCKHCLTSETKNAYDAIFKCSYLVRQFHFKSENNFPKYYLVSRCTRTRWITMELVEWNSELHLCVTCDYGCILIEFHMYRHAQHVLSNVRNLDYFHHQCCKSCFNLMLVRKDCT